MKLKIVSLTETFQAENIEAVNIPGEKGCYSILPHHIDYAALVCPGVLTFRDAAGGRTDMAVDEGLLIKKGNDVYLSCRNAIKGMPETEINALKTVVHDRFEVIDETEKKTREMLSRMESSFVRRFLEMK
ncbi:MAG: F0F1 ATP synthase subunit epsilon [Candidatus Goldbacteria bacterium]|nr:F0F1 ATP synthase subunit epsilon [Candidatus Goldiibacteriota bacterium]